ncbi:MAG: PDZ domain-containing protein [Gemmatimonadales bacterium]
MFERSVGIAAAALLALSASGLTAQQPAPPVSAPLTNLRYEVTFDSASAKARTLKVAMSFNVAGPGPVLLSIPAWTPGAYELSFFARWVSGFAPEAGGRPLAWDKLDYDTWRVQPNGAKAVTVRFDYLADTLDNAMAWSRPDFVLFNGTNVLPYAEGRGLDFPATVTVKTEPGWLVATGMQSVPQQAGSYREGNYHDLVDKPFFVGRMDYDSTQVDGRWTRLASYPAGILSGQARRETLDQLGKMIPAEAKVFQETPWPHYTVMMIFDSAYGGGSALEHTNSHVGIYSPGFIGNPILASITAHEIFHAWNVKRLRPADMVPYRYDRSEPTPWLWVSEGITDYYADLAIMRGGIVTPDMFLGTTGDKIAKVSEAPPTALEDASLSTWIHPTDGSQYLYYPKGSLAGFMLDILIRDASDNRQSLDGVMRSLYRSTWKAGRGFTGTEWWRAVTAAAGGKSFAEFAARYVDGREPYPWAQILPLVGLRIVTDTILEPRIGLASALDSAGRVVVRQVMPGSAGEEAGVRSGDVLLSLGDIPITDADFGPKFRARFGKEDGQALPIQIERAGQRLTLNGKIRLVPRVESRLAIDPAAPARANRVREGIFKGVTGP